VRLSLPSSSIPRVPVTPPDLLNGLNPGDKIGFTIDAAKSTIVAIEVIEAAK